MSRVASLALALLLLSACAADLPMPAVPPLATEQQREQARGCQATYAQCSAPCRTTLVWTGPQMHEATKCVHNCKELLAGCYATLP